MHKKFEINQKKMKGGCQSGRTVVTHNSKSDLPLAKHALKNKAYASTYLKWICIVLFDATKKVVVGNYHLSLFKDFIPAEAIVEDEIG